MDKQKVSRKQLQAMLNLTEGYNLQDHEFWVSAQRLVYFYVYNVVYVIDQDGNWSARSRFDGEPIDGSTDAYLVG